MFDVTLGLLAVSSQTSALRSTTICPSPAGVTLAAYAAFAPEKAVTFPLVTEMSPLVKPTAVSEKATLKSIGASFTWAIPRPKVLMKSEDDRVGTGRVTSYVRDRTSDAWMPFPARSRTVGNGDPVADCRTFADTGPSAAGTMLTPYALPGLLPVITGDSTWTSPTVT